MTIDMGGWTTYATLEGGAADRAIRMIRNHTHNESPKYYYVPYRDGYATKTYTYRLTERRDERGRTIYEYEEPA